jgi:hypothetical protein
VAEASAVRSINREIAAALGTAVLAAVVTSRLGAVAPESVADVGRAQDAYNAVFLISFVALVAALAMAAFLPGRRKMKGFQEARAAEHARLVAHAD